MAFLADAAALQQQQVLQHGISFQRHQHGPHQLLDLLPAIAQRIKIAQAFGEDGPALIEHCFQQTLLAAEMLHQLRFTAARGAGDGHRAGVLVATFGEQLLGHLQHAVPCWQMTRIRAHGK